LWYCYTLARPRTGPTRISDESRDIFHYSSLSCSGGVLIRVPIDFPQRLVDETISHHADRDNEVALLR